MQIFLRQYDIFGKGAVAPYDAEHSALRTVEATAGLADGTRITRCVNFSHDALAYPRLGAGGNDTHKLVPQHAFKRIVTVTQF